MKKAFTIYTLFLLLLISGLILIKQKPSQLHTIHQKAQSSAELKSQVIERKIERRKKGWSKPDKPSEFIKYYNKIRTKDGHQAPDYKADYKMHELKAAIERTKQLKSSFTKLNWIERGPGNVSGRTRALLIDIDDPSGNSWFVGSVSGGVWKTTDAGASWTNLTPDLPNLATVSLAQSQSNPNVIYAGTGEGFFNLDAITGDGIFKSSDKGNTWIQLLETAGNNDFSYVNRIVVSPSDPNIILAATNTSIQKSTDGGQTWHRVFDDFHRIQQIVANPDDFSILYATANTGGILKSTDMGEHWEYVFNESSGRIELAIAPSNSNIIYALNEDSQLYVSNNGGITWATAKQSSGSDIFLGFQGWYNNSMAVAPNDPNLLVIGGINLYMVRIVDTSTTPTIFLNVSAINVSSFLSFTNFGGPYLGGGMEINKDKTNYNTIEVQFGPGKSQLAHRFTVPIGSSAGVPDSKYSYQDYIEVPFEVWDTDKNRQLMISFRDQDRNGVFNLTSFNDNTLTGREYVWIQDIDYDTIASALVAKNGGQIVEEIAFFWPVLADNATWPPTNLQDSKIKITRDTVYSREYLSTKVADWNGQGAPYVHADNHQIKYIETTPNKYRIIVSNDGGVGYSDNLGKTWTNPTNGYNSTQFYGVDKHPNKNQYVGGMQDNGTWISPENPDHLSNWFEATYGDGFDAIWHATHPEKVMTSGYYNELNISSDNGASWSSADENLLDVGDGYAPFITQLGYSVYDPDKVFVVGVSGISYSTDFGKHWSVSKILSGQWTWSDIGFVEPSLANPQIVWAATRMSSRGSILLSTDGGKTFNQTNNYKEELGTLSGLATHPLNDSIAYALFSYASYPKILMTTNRGQSWEDLSGYDFELENNGFPDVAVFSLMVMPNNTNEIWVGTEIGLFISTDNGKTWNYSNNGLPSVAIWEIKARGSQIIMATHGRGVWTADITELNDAIVAPSVMAIGCTPSNNILLQTKITNKYDSIAIIIDDTSRYVIDQIDTTNNFNKLTSIQFENKLRDGKHNLVLIAYKDKYVLRSGSTYFYAIHYQPSQETYNNSFDELSNDILGIGFEQTSNNKLGEGLAIHTKHPYPEDTMLYCYLNVPITIQTSRTVVSYLDIPMLEEGLQNSVYGESDFFDYAVCEASTNGIDWIPMYDGYDFSLIKEAVNQQGKTINSSPDSTLFVQHSVNLNDIFEVADTVILRFRLFSDANTTGWGWVIDDISIGSGIVDDVNSLSAEAIRLYPNPCSNWLNINLPDKISKVNLTVYNLEGRKIFTETANHQQHIKLNTTSLKNGVYMLKIESDGLNKSLRFQVQK